MKSGISHIVHTEVVHLPPTFSTLLPITECSSAGECRKGEYHHHHKCSTYRHVTKIPTMSKHIFPLAFPPKLKLLKSHSLLSYHHKLVRAPLSKSFPLLFILSLLLLLLLSSQSSHNSTTAFADAVEIQYNDRNYSCIDCILPQYRFDVANMLTAAIGVSLQASVIIMDTEFTTPLVFDGGEEANWPTPLPSGVFFNATIVRPRLSFINYPYSFLITVRGVFKLGSIIDVSGGTLSWDYSAGINPFVFYFGESLQLLTTFTLQSGSRIAL